MERDDLALIRRCKRGDDAAFRALMERYQRQVFGVAFAMLEERQEAEDLVQDAFIRVYQGLGGFKGDSSFRTWLFRIVRNLCVDRLRSRRSRGAALGEEQDLADVEPELERVDEGRREGPVDALLRRELGEQILAGLEKLSEAHREILVLREVEGLAYEELAKVLGIPKGTVMSRLHHARARLQRELGTYLHGEDLKRVAGKR